MQRATFILACFFICVTCFSQQYPFVHYTPKDGLISNQIRNIYQDSKGRLYFTSVNGLSVYDGSRFINYTSKNGLDNDIVNCVMEMGNDSLWIITNSGLIHCLVNGKLKPVELSSPPLIIDFLMRNNKNIIYAASERGLHQFQQNGFLKLPFINNESKDVNTFISSIVPEGNHLLILRDNLLISKDERYILYLYDIERKKIITQTNNEKIYAIAKSPDGRIWVSTEKNIMSVDTMELKNGKIVLQELPEIYKKIKQENRINIYFDQQSNCWFSDRVSILKKVDTDGNVISFTTASGLQTTDVNYVFQDKEGTIWIAFFSAGVDKLVHSNFSLSDELSGVSAINYISYASGKNQLLLYSATNAKALFIGRDNSFKNYEVDRSNEIQQLIETPKGLYGISEHLICKLNISGNKLYSKPVFIDSINNYFISPLIDKNGNLILCGKYYLTALLDGKTICRKKINYHSDQAALDTNGNIWIVTRANELNMFKTNPGDPSNYLEQKLIFTKELSDISPRSFTIDRNNIFWVGSRSNGLFAFRFQNRTLTKLFHLNTTTGLSENFVSWLAADADNNIWACTPSGLDMISIKNEIPVIENITRQNNIYQSVHKVVIDHNKTTWALLSNGLIKITPEKKIVTGYIPKLIISAIKSGKDTIEERQGKSLSHKQNNLSFYFSAPTYLDEKQVQYSYQLKGSINSDWSEPSNNAFISFINLQTGDYILNVKANFPASRYPEQNIQYKFSILPPWWQTWWFRSIAGVFIIGLLITGSRFYYRRKLEMQMAGLEKQQAIEKERTRIATDMHDDLGAGLSRIKFLSQSILKKEHDGMMKSEMEKITSYSDEMSEKMGEIIWALNEKNDTLADLIAYTRSYTAEYLTVNNIECEANTPLHLPGTFITGEIRRNIFLAVKECLHNIVKHAEATKVSFSIVLDHDMQIVIHDNGKGIDWSNQRAFSNGIQNIKKRMKEINGEVNFANEQGTKVSLNIPLIL